MAAGKKRVSLDTIIPAAKDRPDAGSPEPTSPPAGRRPHVKQVTLYMPHGVHDALREVAYHERAKIHDLLREAVDLVLAKRGKKSWAELSEDAG